MGAKVTMRDVARAAGVSTMTVSRALKQESSVNAKTRALVQSAADTLGYVYDTTAQAFRSQKSGFLAVILPSINNANFAATHRALTQALARTDLQLLLGVTNYRLEEEERLVRQLLARRPEAIVLTGGHHTAATRSLLKAIDIPVVEIWDIPADPIGSVVGFSNAAAMELVVEHLVSQGRRKLGFLGASGESDRRGADRRRGAIAAAKRLGLPELVHLDAGEAPATMTSGAQAVEGAQDVLRNLDALICVSDPVAFGACMSLQRLGFRVPEDIALTGFGSFEIAAVSNPTITTVEVGASDIGAMTGAAIAHIIEEQPTDIKTIFQKVTPQLVHGTSS